MALNAACLRLCAASSVTDSVAGSFVAAASQDLVIARANVVALHTWDAEQSALRCVAEVTMCGRVVSLTAIPASLFADGAVCDRLLVVADESHATLASWDAGAASWRTLQMFVLSPPEASATPATSMRANGLAPIVRVDRIHRLCAILSHRRFLHVLRPATAGAVDGATAAATGAQDADDGWADDSDDEAVKAAVAAAPGAGTASAPPLAVSGVVDMLAGIPNLSMAHIRDFTFFAATNEPTVAVLRDIEPTWAGRIKLLASTGARVKGLSCSVAVLTLPPASNSNATPLLVGSTDSIPYDALSLAAVPSGHGGIGGAIVVCANSLVHVSLKGKSFAAWLNRHGEDLGTSERSQVQWDAAVVSGHPASTVGAVAFPEGASVAPLPVADGATAAVKFGFLVVSRESGSAYTLSCDHDGRSVHRICLTRVGPLCQAQATVVVSSNAPDTFTAFFASNLSDSVLAQVTVTTGSDRTAPVAAKLRAIMTLPSVGPVQSFCAVDGTTPDAELSGAAAATSTADAHAAGGDVDAVENPFMDGSLEHLLVPATPASQLPTLRERLLSMDLALCGGRGDKHGALTVTAKHARVDSVLRTPIDCVAGFCLSLSPNVELPVDSAASSAAIIEAAEASAKRDRDGEERAAPANRSATRYVVLSTAQASIVVEIADRLKQLEPNASAFVNDRRTVAALVRGGSEDAESPLAFALQFTLVPPSAEGAEGAAAGPTGMITVVPLDDITKCASEVELPSVPVAVAAVGLSQALVLLDGGALLSLKLNADGTTSVTSVTGGAGLDRCAEATAICALPALLEGDGAPAVARALVFTKSGDAVLIAQGDANDGWKPSGLFKAFSGAPQVVASDGTDAEVRVSVKAKPSKRDPPPPVVIDAAASRLTSQRGIPDAHVLLTVAFESGELAVYRLETTSSTVLRASKLAVDTHDVPPPASTETSIAEKRLRQQIGADKGGPRLSRVLCPVGRLAPAAAGTNGALDGILVTGTVPKIIVSDRGIPRIHPLRFEGDVPARAFARLDCPQCPAGFIVCAPGVITFGRLAAARGDVDLRAVWPRQRVPTRGTPHHVAYNASRRACFVATSRREPFRPTKAPFDKELQVNPDSGGGPSAVVAAPTMRPVGPEEGIPVPMADRYSVQLFNSAGWAHADGFEMLENETVLSMTSALLSIDPAHAGTPPVAGIAPPAMTEVIAVGTGFPLGEDHPCRGRLLLLGVKVTGRGATAARQLVELAAENTKGPVTAVTTVHGALVAAVGATIKVMAADWMNGKLTTRALAHAPTFVTSLSSFKNYLVIGDLQRSVCFARYVRAHQAIEMIAHDPTTKDSLSVGAVFGPSRAAGVVTFDSRDNVQVFAVEPQVAPNGTDLLKRPLRALGHFKLSGTVRDAMPLRQPANGRLGLLDTSAELYVTAEGEVGVVAPVSEKAVRASRWLASRIATEVPQPFGMHPLASRQGSMSVATGLHGTTLVDGDLLGMYMQLSADERRAIATRAGTSTERARNILVALQLECDWF